MNRACRVLTLAFACALGACTQSPATTSPAGQAGQGGSAGSSAGVAGRGGAAGATSSHVGASGSGGAAVAGSGGDVGTHDASVDLASPIDAPPDVTDAAADASGGCPASAVVCDDFEKYANRATSLAPDWIAYTYSGAVHVDGTKPHAGKQSLHLTAQAGAHHYADLIRATRNKEVLPLAHYGRLMVWLTAVPPSSHWNLNMSSGPMVGFPDEQAKFFEGGMYGKLMSNYAQRSRILVNGQELLRGGGPEAGDPGADADCAVAAPTQKIAAGRWVCWEWEFDGVGNEAHLWIDGQPMTEVDAVGSGKQCQGPGFQGRQMMPTYKWEGPALFDKLIIGWEQYQDTPAQELWIDDVVVGPDRVGCPSP